VYSTLSGTTAPPSGVMLIRVQPVAHTISAITVCASVMLVDGFSAQLTPAGGETELLFESLGLVAGVVDGLAADAGVVSAERFFRPAVIIAA
jgi:hypothetical protein